MTPTVDLHHHVIPDFYWEASNEDGNAAGGIDPPRWSLDGAIAYLDDAGIDVAATQSRSVASVSFRALLNLTTASAATFWVRRPLVIPRLARVESTV